MKILAVLFALMLSACASRGGGGPVPQPPPVNIIPMDFAVMRSNTDKPLANATVVCNGVEWGKTNADGYLLQPMVPAGVEISCTVSAEGFHDAEGQLFTPTTQDPHFEIWLVPVALPLPELKPLRVSDSKRWFKTDDGLMDFREVTAMALQSRMMRGEAETKVRPFVKWMKAHKVTVLRVLLTLGGDYWESQNPSGDNLRSYPSDPGWWENFDYLLRIHREEGMYIRLTIFGALEPFGGVWDPIARRDLFQGEVRRRGEEFAKQVAERVRNQDHVILEIANEPGNIGFRDSSRALRDLGCEVKRIAPMRLVHLGDERGMKEEDVYSSCFDFIASHVDRSPGLRFIEMAKRMGEVPFRDDQPRAMPALSGEPANFGEVRKDGRTGDVARHPIAAYAYAVVCRSRQFLCNFHYDGGLWGNIPNADTEASLNAFNQALDAFPMVDGNRWRGHWSPEQGNYWRRDPYPGNDDARTVEDHVNSGRGPWRVFGVGDWSAAFPFRPGANWSGWLAQPADLVDMFTDDMYSIGIYKRR